MESIEGREVNGDSYALHRTNRCRRGAQRRRRGLGGEWRHDHHYAEYDDPEHGAQHGAEQLELSEHGL